MSQNKNYKEKGIPPDEFFKSLKSKIRINKKNLNLSGKFFVSEETVEEDYDTALLRVLENSYRKYKRPRYYINNQVEEEKTSAKLDSGSSFILFILKKKHFMDVVPDIELAKYKEVCCDMISKLSNCHEAHFGLAQILAHEGIYEQAEQHLNIALSEEKNSEIYNMWLAVIKSLNLDNKQKAITAKRLCECKRYIALIRRNYTKIELYWALMNISLYDYLIINQEIECPQHYASKIKEIDDFYGYLAWSEVYIRSQAHSNQEKSENILKELIKLYPSRPEAYIKLWYYYYSSESYGLSLSVSESAFLKLAQSSGEYTVIINLNYARSLFKMKKYRSSFELLQMMYTQYSQYSIYLYHYGRLCLKSKDSVFLGSAVGALEECLKICSEYRYGSIYYWLMIGYLMGNDKVQAYNYAKAGTKILSCIVDKFIGNVFQEKSYEKKIIAKLNEMKNVLKDMHIDILNMEILDKIIDNYDKNKLEEAKIHCKNIMKFDHIEGNIYIVKLMLANGEVDLALEMLQNSIMINSLTMKSFFLFVHILNQQGDNATIEKVCKEMMKKCKNPMIPVQIWIKTHMIYIKCLINKKEYQQAILILKSLAQVQPSPFIPDLDYTKHLQFATSKEQLIHTTEAVAKDLLPGNDDIHNNILSRARLLCSRRNLSSIIINSSDNEPEMSSILENIDTECEEIGIRAPEPLLKARISRTPVGDAVNTGFSVSISYKFLYMIGKIAAMHNVCIEDGYYAMHDFLNIHHYWMREGIEKDEKMQVKGQYWLGVLYYLRNDFHEAVHIFQDIMSMLFQLNLEKMSKQIQKYLKEYNSR